jgi:hypothetical protein
MVKIVFIFFPDHCWFFSYLSKKGRLYFILFPLDFAETLNYFLPNRIWVMMWMFFEREFAPEIPHPQARWLYETVRFRFFSRRRFWGPLSVSLESEEK